LSLLTVTNIELAYGTQIILDGATLAVDPGEKIGLVGRNGSGKTSLMRILLGAQAPDRGEVQLQRGIRVGYLSQDPEFDVHATVRATAEGAFTELHQLHVALHELFERMAEASADELTRLLKTQARLEAQIEAAGGYAIDHRIDATLHGLGFDNAQFQLNVGSLSGGQRGRLGLARLLLEAPDLLLLDEPTNHLDIAGREWLETFLADSYPGAVIVVSHDRWLLDRLVSRIVEVEAGAIREYPGGYEKYVSLRRERQLTQTRAYKKQLDHVRREQGYIRRYKAGQRARQAKGRETRLDRFKEQAMVERPVELDVMKLALPPSPRSGDLVIEASGIGKSYGERTLFGELDLVVTRGDRIGVIGPNGSGKSTLLRCLLAEFEPDTGTVRCGSRLSIGYYQQLHDHLDADLTVWEYLQSVVPSPDGRGPASEQQARDLAGAFLFSGLEQDKRLGEVSGGERSRAVLAGLVAGAHNLLVLDEPMNHLDIPSAERLEQVLTRNGSPSAGQYDGTLILVSHDRALLQATCNTLVVLDGEGAANVFEGSYLDLQSRSQPQDVAPAPKPRRTKQPKASATPSKADPLRRLKLDELEKQIEQIEGQISRIDQKLVSPKATRDGDYCRELLAAREALRQSLVPLEQEWAHRAQD
jgi:ATP-binding cassette subfamily F protein 3